MVGPKRIESIPEATLPFLGGTGGEVFRSDRRAVSSMSHCSSSCTARVQPAQKFYHVFRLGALHGDGTVCPGR